MELVNLTPHTITVIVGEKAYEIKATGVVARLTETRRDTGEINGMPSCSIEFGHIDGLPESQDGTLYIVSALVGPVAAAQGRHDVIAPDTGKAIRKDGAIVGVPGFVRY